MHPLRSFQEELYQTNIPAEEFASRRRALAELVGDGATILLAGATRQSGSVLFRQTNEFYHLSGVEVADSYLVIAGGTGRTTLYLPRRDPAVARGEGRLLDADEESAVELTGVQDVRPRDQLWNDLARPLWYAASGTVYTPFSPGEGFMASRDETVRHYAALASDPLDGRSSREASVVRRIRETFPQLAVRDLSPMLDELRLIKSEREVDLLRRAGSLSGQALLWAMRSTRPGLGEGHLAALINFVFLAGGARGEAYRSIVASGPMIWHGHYTRNARTLRPGDLILVDAAPDFAYYTSDIGRMWPVDGHYDRTQRALYGFMVTYHQTLLARIRPGVTADVVMDEAAQEMREVVERTAFDDPTHRAAALRTLEWRGHLSHPVGMAVHDDGEYRDRPLVKGMVFSVDPSLWIPEENGYVRVEDTVAVTDDGVEVLTSAAPLSLDETEAAMAGPSLLEVFEEMGGELYPAAPGTP
jgi:Xaa-Pro aminopeptidase